MQKIKKRKTLNADFESKLLPISIIDCDEGMFWVDEEDGAVTRRETLCH